VARQFLGLYLLIVATLAAASWGQEWFLQRHGVQDADEDRSTALIMTAVGDRLRDLPEDRWAATLAALTRATGTSMEVFGMDDIIGGETLDRLARGEIAHMQSSGRQNWSLRRLDAGHVLALEFSPPNPRRSVLDWSLTLLFYTVIALVIMIWLWPLTRDLRALEDSAARFGNRQWRFDVGIKARSPIFPLAETFRRMAARIDGLIASHKDMSNAVSHEIKTPLARMQFEIEMARQAQTLPGIRDHLEHLRGDVAAIDDLVKATLGYAILERADLSLQVGTHDFATLLPALAERARRGTRPEIRLVVDVRGDASAVVCDLHLMESVVQNLLNNALRFARQNVRVRFSAETRRYRLTVEDDGPGIPPAERDRVFQSFVQLSRPNEVRTGFGLGLAIVKRILEWHDGEVAADASDLGGARLDASWPSRPAGELAA
jgi:two-component system, OmpR family, sensor kinase